MLAARCFIASWKNMNEGEEQPRELKTASFAAHATRGIIRDPKTRRWAMFLVLLAALLMAVSGATLLREVLDPRERTLWFILFWLACAWLTVSALLLALFDILLTRAAGRAARRALRGQYSKRD